MTGKRRILTDLRLDKIAAVNKPCQEHAKAVMFKNDASDIATVDDLEKAIMKRDYSADERQAMADAGTALPDGSFPISDVADLKNAIQAYGRASDKAKAKAHIVTRARALDAIDQLPDDWNIEKMIQKVADLCSAGNGGAPQFGDIFKTQDECTKLWDARDTLWPLVNSVSESLNSIVLDTSMSAQVREQGIHKSVDDFLNVVREKAPQVQTELGKLVCAGKSGGTKETKMTEAEKIADLEKQLAKAKQDAEDLKDGGKDEAMEDANGKITAKGQAFIAKHATEDEVLKVGEVSIRKSQTDASVFAMMKAQQVEITKANDRAELATLEKRAADEFSHLPGTPAEIAGVLKSAALLPDASKEAFEKMMKAHEAMAAKAFDRIGSSGGVVIDMDVKKAAGEFEGKVSEIAKRDNIGNHTAMAKARKEHPELFAKAYPSQAA